MGSAQLERYITITFGQHEEAKVILGVLINYQILITDFFFLGKVIWSMLLWCGSVRGMVGNIFKVTL
jgi:hypothetical protein